MTDVNNLGVGSNAVEAADNVGGVYYPRVKLVNSTEDSTEEIGTTLHPLPVSGSMSATMDGAAVTGETIESGGSGAVGWLSSIRMAIKTTLMTLLNAIIVAQGTTASSKVLMVGGKSNDATAQYGELPLGPGKRSVVVEGNSSGVAVPVTEILGGSAVSQTNPLPVSQTRVVCAAADVHAPAANTAAVVTYAADATHKHIITGVAWSYAGGIPVGGNLKIEDGSGTVVFSIDIDKSGPGSYDFPRPKIGAAVNTAMIITLAAGGAGVTGKLSVENHWLEA